jgi:hypothetical protein
VPKRKISQEVTDHWPGVLDEVDIRVVPIEYIQSIEVKFDDGKIWVMDVDDQKSDAESLEYALEELLQQYEDVIDGVNFVVDIPKVKADITKRTKLFMKKKK